MKTIKQILSIALLSIFAISCSKDDGTTSTESSVAKAVYACGGISGGPTVWKDGVATTLLHNGNASVNAVVAVGSDVYAAGYDIYKSSGKIPGLVSVAKYWKNGTPISLSDGTHDAYAYDIKVVGNDVYVVGEQINPDITTSQATIWKNGVATTLTIADNGVYESRAYSLSVVGNDVYVLGAIYYNAAYSITVWKNGIATPITDKNNANTYASSIFVSGTDVYVAGRDSALNGGEVNVATVWKNGVKTSLTTGQNGDAGADDIFVLGTDVYVAGYENRIAKFWKNGTPTSLTDGINYAEAQSITVSGTDVYVAFSDYDKTIAKSVAKVWKNGTVTTYGDGINESYINSITTN